VVILQFDPGAYRIVENGGQGLTAKGLEGITDLREIQEG